MFCLSMPLLCLSCNVQGQTYRMRVIDSTNLQLLIVGLQTKMIAEGLVQRLNQSKQAQRDVCAIGETNLSRKLISCRDCVSIISWHFEGLGLCSSIHGVWNSFTQHEAPL